MKSVKVLDATLRDGGCVIDFNFGQNYMEQILAGLEASGVDFIELGYLDEKKGSEQGRTQYINEQVIKQHFLHKKKPGVTYLAMFDYGKFNPDNLLPNDGNGIDGIRIAFHKKDRFNVIPVAKKVLEKGYKVFIQPMVVMRYSDEELLDLIHTVNTEVPDASAFYVVDSFGEMRQNDLNRLVYLVDHNLKPGMPMGLHSHNNLQLSYANAVSMLNFYSDRDLMIDGSVLGMGKGAGNLSTELFLEHLNLYYNKNYKILPLLEIIDRVLNTIRAESYWGYSIEYYLSSANHCTPSYAGHFYKKHMLHVEQVSELLGMIAEEKKISFDQNYADQLYLAYNARRHLDDDPAVKQLQGIVGGKRVLLLAPGKSLKENKERITGILQDPDIISISLNYYDLIDTDYVLITRTDAFQAAHNAGRKIITTSGVCPAGEKDVLVIDYEKWIEIENGVQDSSGVVALKLISACGASEILLAGFDGFSSNMNQNYYDKSMRRPVSEEQAQERNEYFRSLISRVRATVPVTFLTESLYGE